MSQYRYKTAKAFERHLQKIGVNLEKYHSESVSLPCTCSWDLCGGWATVRNTPDSIRSHIREELKRNSGCWNVAEFMKRLEDTECKK